MVEVTFTVNDTISPRPSLLSEQQPPIRPAPGVAHVNNLNDEEERRKIVTRYANKNPAAADELRQYVDMTSKKNPEKKPVATPEQAQSLDKLAEPVERPVMRMKRQNGPQTDTEHENIV